MSEYTDFWKSLDLPADQSPKAQAFNTVASNTDKLSLTPAQEYSMGWGMDAVPEDWVKARAQEITNQIHGSESTAVLKRGAAAAPVTQVAKDAAAVQAAGGVAGGSAERGGSRGGDHGDSGSDGLGGREAGMGLGTTGGDISFGFDAKAGLKGLLVGGPLMGVASGVVSGSSRNPLGIDEASRTNEATRLNNKVASMREQESRDTSGLNDARDGFGRDAGMGAAESGSGLNGTGLGGGYGNSPSEGRGGSSEGGRDAAGGTNGHGGGSDSGGPGRDRD